MSLQLWYPVEKCIAIQQDQADEILGKLFLIDPYAICAGGAPRDWHFGKVATDLDFFICPSSYLPSHKVKQQLENVGLTIVATKYAENLPDVYKRNPHLGQVFEVEYHGSNVQIMRMHEPTFRSVLPQFPLSICKAWYKNHKIRLDRDFTRGENHKVIVKTNTVYNDEHAYVQKILAKFPEYRYHESWEKAASAILDKV